MYFMILVLYYRYDISSNLLKSIFLSCRLVLSVIFCQEFLLLDLKFESRFHQMFSLLASAAIECVTNWKFSAKSEKKLKKTRI